MFDTILTRLFPASMLGGLALYLVITMLWLQPLVERRMADLHLIPACEAALAFDEASTPEPRNQAQAETEMALKLLDVFTRQSGLDQVPGVTDTLDAVEGVVEGVTPKQPRVSTIDRGSVCGCSVDKAFAELGFAMTLHVASARSYSGTKIDTLPQSTLAVAQSGQCGALPRTKG